MYLTRTVSHNGSVPRENCCLKEMKCYELVCTWHARPEILHLPR